MFSMCCLNSRFVVQRDSSQPRRQQVDYGEDKALLSHQTSNGNENTFPTYLPPQADGAWGLDVQTKSSMKAGLHHGFHE